MNDYLVRARAFWAERSLRERAFLAAGSAILLIGLGYALVVDPLVKANGKLAGSLPKQRAELRLMRAQVSEIERLRGRNRSVAKTGSALIHTVETSAAAHGVREAVTSLAPLAADRLRVTTGPMAATAWLAWFADLEQEGLTAVSCRISTDAKPGVVSIEAILAGGGG